MTDIEQNGQALLTEVRKEASKMLGFNGPTYQILTRWADNIEAMCRLLEEFEAYKREVSDVCEKLLSCTNADMRYGASLVLNRFILPKPVDPLVEVMNEMGFGMSKTASEEFRAALAARGLEITQKKEQN